MKNTKRIYAFIYIFIFFALTTSLNTITCFKEELGEKQNPSDNISNNQRKKIKKLIKNNPSLKTGFNVLQSIIDKQKQEIEKIQKKRTNTSKLHKLKMDYEKQENTDNLKNIKKINKQITKNLESLINQEIDISIKYKAGIALAELKLDAKEYTDAKKYANIVLDFAEKDEKNLKKDDKELKYLILSNKANAQILKAKIYRELSKPEKNEQTVYKYIKNIASCAEKAKDYLEQAIELANIVDIKNICNLEARMLECTLTAGRYASDYVCDNYNYLTQNNNKTETYKEYAEKCFKKIIDYTEKYIDKKDETRNSIMPEIIYNHALALSCIADLCKHESPKDWNTTEVKDMYIKTFTLINANKELLRKTYKDKVLDQILFDSMINICKISKNITEEQNQ